MKLFSHRGNLTGPDLDLENAPDYIDAAINAGFDVEVDVRVHGGTLHLGHDSPQYPIDWAWLHRRCTSLLLHLKDLESATLLSDKATLHHFCHQADPFVLTSRGFIWLHDTGRGVNDRCIIPVATLEVAMAYAQPPQVYGICSDYVATIRNWLK